jgi:UDP-glucuronate 4-epimerase
MKGEPVEMSGDGSSVRDYTYIDDIVTGTAAALDYDKTGYEIINLGGGEPVKLSRMIEVIEQNAGRTAVIRRMPFQPGDVERTACDFSKAARLLGYRPSTSFEDGIKKFIAWLKLNSGGIRS